MSDRTKELISRKGIVVDLVLTALWLTFFSWILRPYVPAQSEVFVTGFSIYTAVCLTGVFWLALSMFRIVFVDHQLSKQEE